MKCENGLQFGTDFGQYALCDDCIGEELIGCRVMYQTCGNKVGYRSKVIAIGEARELGLSVYECPFCGLYHLSSRGENV